MRDGPLAPRSRRYDMAKRTLYSVEGLPPGNHTLEIRAIGSKSEEVSGGSISTMFPLKISLC